MERRKMEKLNAPSDFLTANVSGASRATSAALLTPSHFTVSSASNPVPPRAHSASLPLLGPRVPASEVCVGVAGLDGPRPPVTPGADPWIIIAHAQQELLELRRENQRLLLEHRDGEMHGPEGQHGDRQREERVERRGEMEQLWEELRKQGSKISRQYGEYEELCAELCRCKAELQENKEKMLQLSESHSAELSVLTQTNSDLQSTLRLITQEVTSLRRQAEEVTSERDALKEQLSTLHSAMVEQTDTLQKLRSYIGAHTGEEQHTHIQKLQKEKESLCLSVELLNVRVKSANDILALQEKELGDQCDPLHQDCRAGRLVALWRQKVFVLLVQLRSRDSQLRAEKHQLHNMVSDLQQEVQKSQSQISVLQHNLQDKTAQLELQNIHTQELQQQLDRAVEENERLKHQKETSEKLLKDITDTAQRVGLCVEEWGSQMDVAQSHMRTLTHRLTFANKRLDTVQGLLLRREALRKAQEATKPVEATASPSSIERLQSEVELLSSERDKLAQELKRTPELIHNALKDLQQQLEREVSLLTQALSRSREEVEVSERRHMEAQSQCEEQERTIAELRAEAHSTQQQCQSVLQERISEMESSCTKQLREMETQLNTARREHTKAVVALRQVERSAQREREQEREAQRTHYEQTHRHITQLHTQLKGKDRDCNVLLAVVQQQGLMNEYKRMRRAAIHTSRATLEEQPNKQKQQQHKQQQHKQQQHEEQQPGDTEQPEGCVLSVLGELHSLSSAVIHGSEEEDEGNEESEEGQGDHLPHHRMTHTTEN